MLLRSDCIVLAYWNYSNVTKIRILDHSKIANNFFPLIRFFSFFYKQQYTWHSWSSSKKSLKRKKSFKQEKSQKSLKVTREEKKKRTVYVEKDKQEIAKYAAICRVTSAIRKFQSNFPNLTKSTVCPWVKRSQKIHTGAEEEGRNKCAITIGRVRGRPLLLKEVIDLKLRLMLVRLNIRTAGASINIHVVSGVRNGLICTNPERFGSYMDLKVTRSLVWSLYQRMKFSRRAVTTTRPVITRSLWAVTLCESLVGWMLSFQLIYTWKMERSLPDFTFPDGFSLALNQKHYSN